jgi:hypothetical protein
MVVVHRLLRKVLNPLSLPTWLHFAKLSLRKSGLYRRTVSYLAFLHLFHVITRKITKATEFSFSFREDCTFLLVILPSETRVPILKTWLNNPSVYVQVPRIVSFHQLLRLRYLKIDDVLNNQRQQFLDFTQWTRIVFYIKRIDLNDALAKAPSSEKPHKHAQKW